MTGRKAAIVTGAGSGIGRAIAQRLAEDGLAVAVLDLDDRAAEQTRSARREARQSPWAASTCPKGRRSTTPSDGCARRWVRSSCSSTTPA